MKRFNIVLFCSILILISCDDFLDRTPNNVLSSSSFYKTENDANLALVGCYEKWWTGANIINWDATSDNAYNFHVADGYQQIGNGSMSPSNPGAGFYDYSTITRCNIFLSNLENVEFKTKDLKERLCSEARFLRAWRYFIMVMNYGEVPLITQPLKTIEEAKISKSSQDEICNFIYKELDEITKDGLLPTKTKDGKISQGAALAFKMRFSLYKGNYKEALDAAHKIQTLGYTLFNSYEKLFTIDNENNDEIILSCQALENDYKMSVGAIAPNSAGGWSSHVPTKSLVDAYEMSNGLTIEEAKTLGLYDPSRPFKNRDPRLKATILYPGQNLIIKGKNTIFNPLDPTNIDYPTKANNSTKTAFNLKKYLFPLDQYTDLWNTGMDIIVFRYAEVLLTIAEAKVEMNIIDSELYNCLDAIRKRVGMPEVNRSKYSTQDKLRELIRRERRVEFAFEGLRRYDIIRWGIADHVLNGKLYGCAEGKVLLDESLPEDDRVILNPDKLFFVEDRTFNPQKNKYLPIPQSELDKNSNLSSAPY